MLVQPSLFARLVAHDLRSPITAAAEALALSETAAPVMAEKLREIARKNLCRAEKMVSGLRSFVRAEGEPDFIEQVDIRKMLIGIIEGIENSMDGNRTKIRFVGDLGLLYSCEGRVSHVFRNLIVNAIEHNEGVGGLEIQVGRREGGDAAFYVSDNGKGIASRDHQQIFEPFRRVHNEPGDGMGLGLSLVRSLLGQVGGQVWVESEIGCGATFWFSWPEPAHIADRGLQDFAEIPNPISVATSPQNTPAATHLR